MGQYHKNKEPEYETPAPRAAHTVMVLDDNMQQSLLIQTLLKRKLGYQVKEMTSSGIMALSQSSHTVPDIIVVDISSCAEPHNVIAECKSRFEDAPIVVLVKYGDYQQAAEALLVGAYDFLTKPVAEERISLTLRNAIDAAELKREKRALAARAAASLPRIMPDTQHATISLINSQGHTRKIDEIEQEAIRFAIRFYDGRMTEVARKLGIGRSTLYRKLGAPLQA